MPNSAHALDVFLEMVVGLPLVDASLSHSVLTWPPLVYSRVSVGGRRHERQVLGWQNAVPARLLGEEKGILKARRSSV